MEGAEGEPIIVQDESTGYWGDRAGWLLVGMCWWVAW